MEDRDAKGRGERERGVGCDLLLLKGGSGGIWGDGVLRF